MSKRVSKQACEPGRSGYLEMMLNASSVENLLVVPSFTDDVEEIGRGVGGNLGVVSSLGWLGLEECRNSTIQIFFLKWLGYVSIHPEFQAFV